MSKILVLLTTNFPFNNYESFLQNEIQIASENFDKVYIFSTVKLKSATPIIPLPMNVIATPLIFGSDKVDNLFGGLRYIFSKHETWNLIKKQRKGLKNKLYYAYSRSRAENYYSKLKYHLKLLNLNDDDHILIYSYWLNFFSFAAAKLKKEFFTSNNNVKVICRGHRFDLYDDINRFGFMPLKNYSIKYLDEIFACSKNGSDYLQRKFPEYAGKISHSYLGTQDYGESKYVFNEQKFTIASCSYCNTGKRINLIIGGIKAFVENYAKNSKRRIQWIHLGDGLLLDDLKCMAENELKNRVEFAFYGKMTNLQINEFYKNNQVDLFINTSDSEGLPVSMMEASSFDIPLIGTDVGGTSEIVDIDNKLLLPANPDLKDIAEAIRYVYEMPETELIRLRERTRKEWKQKFDNVRNYREFYKINEI